MRKMPPAPEPTTSMSPSDYIDADTALKMAVRALSFSAFVSGMQLPARRPTLVSPPPSFIARLDTFAMHLSHRLRPGSFMGGSSGRVAAHPLPAEDQLQALSLGWCWRSRVPGGRGLWHPGRRRRGGGEPVRRARPVARVPARPDAARHLPSDDLLPARRQHPPSLLHREGRLFRRRRRHARGCCQAACGAGGAAEEVGGQVSQVPALWLVAEDAHLRRALHLRPLLPAVQRGDE